MANQQTIVNVPGHSEKIVVLSSQLTPYEDLYESERLGYMSGTKTEVLQTAGEVIRGSQRLVSRTLVPTDLGLTVQHWKELITTTTGSAWETGTIDGTSTYEVANNRFIGIYAIEEASNIPRVQLLRITKGSTRTHQINLENIQRRNVKIGYLESPIIVSQQEALKIERYVGPINGMTTNGGVVDIRLHGFVVEIEGRVAAA